LSGLVKFDCFIKSCCSLSDGGGGGVSKDTARAHAIVATVHGHVDVTLITPPGAPRVSDDEDFLAVHDLPADSRDGVVEIVGVWAVSGGHDTTGVAHERTVSLDGEGDRTSAESALDSIGSAINVVDIGSRNILGRVRVLASFLTSNIRIVSGQNNWVVSGGLVQRHGPATTATIAVAVFALAINNLLLRKGLNLLVVLNSHSTFKDSHGGERIARTALTLVLDRNNNIITPDEFALVSRALIRSRVGLWLRLGIRGRVDVVLTIVVIEATSNGGLSNSSVLHDAHPPGIELILSPALGELSFALLLFLAGHVSIILIVEDGVESLASSIRFSPFLVVKSLVLFSGHFDGETVLVLGKSSSLFIIFMFMGFVTFITTASDGFLNSSSVSNNFRPVGIELFFGPVSVVHQASL